MLLLRLRCREFKVLSWNIDEGGEDRLDAILVSV